MGLGPHEARRLAIIGSGSLVRTVADALAGAPGPLQVTLIARDRGKLAEVGYVASARAALAGGRVGFETMVADLGDVDAIAGAFDRSAPDGVLVCASTQSPWEGVEAPSGWTGVLDRAGFGLTLPFQAEIALRAARAAAAACPGAWLVNACFPDAVNPLLHAAGIEMLCGIGNVAIIAASLQAALGLADQRRLQVLAHHAQLHEPGPDEDDALAWRDGEPVTEVGALLAPQRALHLGPELNRVTGFAGAMVLRTLLEGGRLDTSLPGPDGLPGGYPVRLEGGRLELRLPPGLDREGAVAFNQRQAARDGVVVEDGRARFGPAAAAALRELAPELAAGFAAAETELAAARLAQVRSKLRDEPAG
jgi:hypothetical protein